MARYFLHLKDGQDEILDPDGEEHVSLESLRASMLGSARDLIAHDAKMGTIDLRYRIEAHTEAGDILQTLPFDEAVTIIAASGSGVQTCPGTARPN